VRPCEGRIETEDLDPAEGKAGLPEEISRIEQRELND